MKNIKKSFIKMTLFGFIILVVFSVFVYGQPSMSEQSTQVSGLIRDLWEKLGNAIFPANLNWDVGIGTNTPQAKLDVAGDVRWSGTLQGGSVPWANVIGFTGDTTPDTIADDGTISDGEASDSLTINNGLLFAPTSGNVGIGTTGPAEKLTVAGVIQSISGGFKFPDGTVQTTAAGGGSGSVTSLNGLTGPVTIAGGGSASVSVSGSTITISTPTCTPATVPIQCNSPYGGCSASCPTGYVITYWSCSPGLPTISGNTGTCTLQGYSVSGWGTCQIVC